MSALRACVTCKDEYYGDSWGVNAKGEELPTLGQDLVCFYCYYGMKDSQFKEEWREMA